MGNRSYVELYSKLLAFLEDRGCSLLEFGSAERGLSYADTRAFIELLRSNEVQLLGFELWRETGGRMEIDIREIWYSRHDDLEARYQDALQFLDEVETGPNDVFAVQFR